MIDLVALNSKLREVERKIQAKQEENAELERRIRENNAEIEREENVAESCRTLIAYESGQTDLRRHSQWHEPFKDRAMDAVAAAEETSKNRIASATADNERKPSEMLIEEFQGVVQNEVVRRILEREPKNKFSTDDIVSLAYDTANDDEYRRARNTMGATLSRGLVKGLWKGEKGFYYLLEENENDSSVK